MSATTANVGDRYNRELCDERHKSLSEHVQDVKEAVADIQADVNAIKGSLLVVTSKLTGQTADRDTLRAQETFWRKAVSMLPWILAALGLGAGVGGQAVRPVAPVAQVEQAPPTPGASNAPERL